jgi:hypothetical protein
MYVTSFAADRRLIYSYVEYSSAREYNLTFRAMRSLKTINPTKTTTDLLDSNMSFKFSKAQKS